DQVERGRLLVPCRSHGQAVGTIPEQPVELVRHHMRDGAALHQVENALPTGTAVHGLAATDTSIRHDLDHLEASQLTVGAEPGFLRCQGDAFPGLFLRRDSEVQYGVSAGVCLATGHGQQPFCVRECSTDIILYYIYNTVYPEDERECKGNVLLL